MSSIMPRESDVRTVVLRKASLGVAAVAAVAGIAWALNEAGYLPVATVVGSLSGGLWLFGQAVR